MLGINKITLIRWDKSGKLPAKRESVSKNRYYSLELIKAFVDYRFHLKKLKKITEEVNKYSATEALDLVVRVKHCKFEDLKKAFEALRGWEGKYKILRRKYIEEKEKYYCE